MAIEIRDAAPGTQSPPEGGSPAGGGPPPPARGPVIIVRGDGSGTAGSGGSGGSGSGAGGSRSDDGTQGFGSLAAGLAQALAGNAANLDTSAPLVQATPATAGSPLLALVVLIGGGAALWWYTRKGKAA